MKNEDTKKVGNVPPRSKANEADLKKFPARMQMKRAGRQQRKTPGTTVPSVVGSQPGNEVKYSVFESEEDVTDTQIIFSQQSQDTDTEAVRMQQMKEEIGMIRILQLQLNTLKEMKREAELKYLAAKGKDVEVIRVKVHNLIEWNEFQRRTSKEQSEQERKYNENLIDLKIAKVKARYFVNLESANRIENRRAHVENHDFTRIEANAESESTIATRARARISSQDEEKYDYSSDDDTVTHKHHTIPSVTEEKSNECDHDAPQLHTFATADLSSESEESGKECSIGACERASAHTPPGLQPAEENNLHSPPSAQEAKVDLRSDVEGAPFQVGTRTIRGGRHHMWDKDRPFPQRLAEEMEPAEPQPAKELAESHARMQVAAQESEEDKLLLEEAARKCPDAMPISEVQMVDAFRPLQGSAIDEVPSTRDRQARVPAPTQIVSVTHSSRGHALCPPRHSLAADLDEIEDCVDFVTRDLLSSHIPLTDDFVMTHVYAFTKEGEREIESIWSDAKSAVTRNTPELGDEMKFRSLWEKGVTSIVPYPYGEIILHTENVRMIKGTSSEPPRYTTKIVGDEEFNGNTLREVTVYLKPESVEFLYKREFDVDDIHSFRITVFSDTSWSDDPGAWRRSYLKPWRPGEQRARESSCWRILG